jgi:myo-inositol 2-dehydrogenase/D-chiro-inositol 1-dehydrogenase
MDRTFEPTFSLVIQRGEQPPENIAIERRAGEVYELVDLVAAVVRAVKEGGPLPCTGEDGFWSAAMCLKAAESVATGSPVALDDAVAWATGS